MNTPTESSRGSPLADRRGKALAALRRVRNRIENWNERACLHSYSAAFGIAALIVSGFSAVYFQLSSVVGTDDAFIYFRVARNIHEGLGPVINAGDLHSPVTSVFWAYVLSWTAELFATTDMPGVARALATVFFFFSGLLLTFSFRHTLGLLAILSPVGLASMQLFHVLPGLETPLALFSLSLVHWCFFGLRSPLATSTLLAFSFFCRGDAILLGVPVGLSVLFDPKMSDMRHLARKLTRMAAAFGAVLTLGLACHYVATGHLLPATLHAKVIQGRGPWPTYGEMIWKYVGQALPYGWLPAALAVVGLLRTRFAGASLLATAIFHWLGYSVLHVADYPWYSWLVWVTLRLLMVFGIGVSCWFLGCAVVDLLHHLLTPRRFKNSYGTAWGLLLAALATASWMTLKEPSPRRYGPNPSITGIGWFKTYYEVSQIACRDATVWADLHRRSPVLLAQEIGILGYFCDILEIRDVNGLASPGLTRETLNNWDYWVELYGPRYLCQRGTRGPEVSFPRAGAPGLQYQLAVLHQGHGFPVSLYQHVEPAETLVTQTLLQRRDPTPRGRTAPAFADDFESGGVSAWSATEGGAAAR